MRAQKQKKLQAAIRRLIRAEVNYAFVGTLPITEHHKLYQERLAAKRLVRKLVAEVK